ncbi:MAG: hypothetical protein CWE10_08750 [Symbiobacterium thermophilum]|uniref:Aminoglycoside phosphotransferase domain-containing protein n=1 Tax=Symbiobacterium thermophilum TaxID=2734 RepID=A0A953I3K8_SYMTR|nr:hypothetical protein [Symbiobacterium thermophilum]
MPVSGPAGVSAPGHPRGRRSAWSSLLAGVPLARRQRLYPEVRAFDEARPHVLLHGDFGWRNLLLCDDGTLVLLDFERAVIGPAWLDQAKCLDRELRLPQDREGFLQGMKRHPGCRWPDHRRPISRASGSGSRRGFCCLPASTRTSPSPSTAGAFCNR